MREQNRTLGDKIRRLRLAAGLSQEQLAGQEMSRSFISLVERGKCRISLELLAVIARRLGKPLEFFLSDEVLPVQLETALHLVKRAEQALQSGQHHTAAEDASVALKNLAHADEPELEARAWWVLASCQEHQGDLAAASVAFKRYVDACTRFGHKAGIVAGCLRLGACLFKLGDLADAERQYARAAQTARSFKTLHDSYIQATLYRASCLTRLGQYTEAKHLYRRVLQETEETANPWLWAMIHMSLGWTCRELGELDEALEHTTRAHEVLCNLNHPDRILAEHNLAILHMDMGNLPLAQRMLDACLAAYQQAGNIEQEASLREDLALWYLQAGDPVRAWEEANRALHLLDNQQNPRLRGRLYLLKARIARDLGRSEEAETFTEVGLAILRRVGATGQAQKLLHALGVGSGRQDG